MLAQSDQKVTEADVDFVVRMRKRHKKDNA